MFRWLSGLFALLLTGVADAETYHVAVNGVDVADRNGLTEAMDSEGNEFGELQLYSSFFAHANLSAQDLVDAIAVDVVSHVQGQLDDDLTIFALSKLPNEDMGGSGEWDGIEQKG